MAKVKPNHRSYIMVLLTPAEKKLIEKAAETTSHRHAAQWLRMAALCEAKKILGA